MCQARKPAQGLRCIKEKEKEIKKKVILIEVQMRRARKPAQGLPCSQKKEKRKEKKSHFARGPDALGA
jgi:hypothetical protein